jgi:hypothetical protein
MERFHDLRVALPPRKVDVNCGPRGCFHRKTTLQITLPPSVYSKARPAPRSETSIVDLPCGRHVACRWALGRIIGVSLAAAASIRVEARRSEANRVAHGEGVPPEVPGQPGHREPDADGAPR